MRHAPLVERFERLRFQSLWHLNVDQDELKRLESEVLIGHPCLLYTSDAADE